MTSVDKAGIFIAIAITVVAVGFTIGGSSILSDLPTADKTTRTVAEYSELAIDESRVKQMKEEAKKTTEAAAKIVKELATSKLPARLVSIPQGTSIPGCHGVDLCYDPPSLIIFVGGEIIWRNDDSSPHTVVSGIVINGFDGKFSSGLVMPGQTFSNRFDESGEYPYFCMIHPWATASVTVK